MAAPDLETLLDFETNVENAAQMFLATDTGLSTSSINLTLDQDELELPRLEVRFDMGEAIDPPDPTTTSSGDLEYRKYSGTLNVIVMTRATEDGSETSHRIYRAKVRKSLLLNADNFTTLPDVNVSGFTITGPTDGSAGGYTQVADVMSRFAADKGDYAVDWNGSLWRVRDDGLSETLWTSSEDVAYPWLVTNWTQVDGLGDAPSLESLTGTNVLPYYDVNYLRPTGTDYSIDGDIAASTLSFSINICIRNDAWPA